MAKKGVKDMVEDGKQKRLRGTEREDMKAKVVEAMDRGASVETIAQVLEIKRSLVVALRQEIMEERRENFLSTDIKELVDRKRRLEVMMIDTYTEMLVAKGNVKAGLGNMYTNLGKELRELEKEIGKTEQRRRRSEDEMRQQARIKALSDKDLLAEVEKREQKLFERKKKRQGNKKSEGEGDGKQ